MNHLNIAANSEHKYVDNGHRRVIDDNSSKFDPNKIL